MCVHVTGHIQFVIPQICFIALTHSHRVKPSACERPVLFPDAAAVFPVFMGHSHSGRNKCDVTDTAAARGFDLISASIYRGRPQ